MDAVIKKLDPVLKQGETEGSSEGISPMDPPDAFSPPHLDSVDHAALSPELKTIIDQLALFQSQFQDFEEALNQIKEQGLDRKVDHQLRHFFRYFDLEFLPEFQAIEWRWYPPIKAAMLKMGRHSQEDEPQTAVDLLRSDGLKVIQLGALVFNFFGLSTRLPDRSSGLIVLDLALEQGKTLAELVRLILFRIEFVLIPFAQKHIQEHMPPDGVQKHMPSDGVQKHMPSDGVQKHIPPDGVQKHMPPDGVQKHMPSDGVQKHMPSDGVQKHMPSDGVQKHMPSDGVDLPLGESFDV